jgi:hypothetical protein
LHFVAHCLWSTSSTQPLSQCSPMKPNTE